MCCTEKRLHVLYQMHYQHVTTILILTGVWNRAGSTAGNNGGGCGGRISPGSIERVKDLTRGPWTQQFTRSFLHGPEEERLVKQFDTRTDRRRPRRPDGVELLPQQRPDFPTQGPHTTERGRGRSAGL
jgi:hypothetical protein